MSEEKVIAGGWTLCNFNAPFNVPLKWEVDSGLLERENYCAEASFVDPLVIMCYILFVLGGMAFVLGICVCARCVLLGYVVPMLFWLRTHFWATIYRLAGIEFCSRCGDGAVGAHYCHGCFVNQGWKLCHTCGVKVGDHRPVVYCSGCVKFAVEGQKTVHGEHFAWQGGVQIHLRGIREGNVPFLPPNYDCLDPSSLKFEGGFLNPACQPVGQETVLKETDVVVEKGSTSKVVEVDSAPVLGKLYIPTVLVLRSDGTYMCSDGPACESEVCPHVLKYAGVKYAGFGNIAEDASDVVKLVDQNGVTTVSGQVSAEESNVLAKHRYVRVAEQKTEDKLFVWSFWVFLFAVLLCFGGAKAVDTEDCDGDVCTGVGSLVCDRDAAFEHCVIDDLVYCDDTCLSCGYEHCDFVHVQLLKSEFVEKSLIEKEYVRRDLVELEYVPIDVVSEYYVNKEAMQKVYVHRDVVARNYMHLFEVYSNWLPRDDVEKHYVHKIPLEFEYVAKSKLSQDWLRVEYVKNNYLPIEKVRSKYTTWDHYDRVVGGLQYRVEELVREHKDKGSAYENVLDVLWYHKLAVVALTLLLLRAHLRLFSKFSVGVHYSSTEGWSVDDDDDVKSGEEEKELVEKVEVQEEEKVGKKED